MTLIQRRPQQDASHLPTDLDPLLRQLYANRGVRHGDELKRDNQSLLHFEQLKGIEQAARLLGDAIISGKKIIVVGDFDADGATSTALCMLALEQLGSCNHTYLVPNRFDFGYGLSPQIVEIAAQQNAHLVLTVDSGIGCFAGVERAKQLGMQVVISDHHLAGEHLPVADAIVNPNQPGCAFASKNLAGVGVAFYLMLAVRRYLAEQQVLAQPPKLAELLDLVALGTVADVVPLDANNRILVYQGLQRIRSGQCRPGIQALLDVAGRDAQRLAASDLGFVLGPRLNAAGRLDDMALGIECLLSHDKQQARQMAVSLDELNQQRREIEGSMQQEAEKLLGEMQFADTGLPTALVLYKPDYHQGVIGILAGRIKDKYHRPTIAFAEQDEHSLKGSARSISGLHIRDLLEEINRRRPGLIDKFGGHAMAAGLSLATDKLGAFEQVFNEVSQEWLAGRDLQEHVLSDGPLQTHYLSLQMAEQLKQAGPWGQGFSEPVFDGTFILREQRLVGNKHLKMLLEGDDHQVYDAIAFNVDLAQWPALHVQQVTLAYQLDVNHFRGRSNLQLLVKALQPVVLAEP